VHVILCNCPPGESESLARALVGEGLAACVNVIPGVTSYYLWKGELCAETEHTLLIKVSDAHRDALTERLAALHSYDVPEILVLDPDVAHCHPAYVAWVRGR
jgi:periplasmic divalent cation tolerance protein